MQVVNAFVDLNTGETIQPGDALPGGLTLDRIAALRRAGCLAHGDPAPAKPKATGDKPAAKPKEAKAKPARRSGKSAAPKSGAKKVARGDGSTSRRRSKPSSSGRKTNAPEID